MLKSKTICLMAAVPLALPLVAAAHHFMDDALPQTFTQGLLSGLGHPLIGADHAAFIVAAGFFLALAGMLHGHAYVETIFGAEPAPLGAYLVGFSLTQLGVATVAFLAHQRLIALREACTGPVSTALGTATGVIGVVVLVAGVAG